MKRKIIDIDQEKCTGCGLCIPDCPEGALQIIDGKARLVSDLFCDGLGACIGTCPEGAICVIEREAGPYDEKAVMATIAPQGEAVIKAHLEHLIGHGEKDLYRQAIEYLTANAVPVPRHDTAGGHAGATESVPTGCPGSAARSLPRGNAGESERAARTESELRQWPVQLKLLNAAASYFDDADLLISGDCVPFAYADFHRDFLRDKIAIIFCPKLDTDVEGYVTKLAEIFSQHTIRSITVLHMEVPCCSGVRYVVDQALKRSGKEIPVKEQTILITGQVAAEGERTVWRRTPPGHQE
ncbi:ATP-binding protein [Methanoculleus sp.]|jgi:NAD-dependent dihydropyrimidine dehydrogenase PreA subunit|uniref:ATP-binding protein n=1 Tax=Methanoculleus sp. TaxID=90427 RepID=UPI0025DC8073|nr:4Fe-4S binding protein [Methanoculleus sp.]